MFIRIEKMFLSHTMLNTYSITLFVEVVVVFVDVVVVVVDLVVVVDVVVVVVVVIFEFNTCNVCLLGRGSLNKHFSLRHSDCNCCISLECQKFKELLECELWKHKNGNLFDRIPHRIRYLPPLHTCTVLIHIYISIYSYGHSNLHTDTYLETYKNIFLKKQFLQN